MGILSILLLNLTTASGNLTEQIAIYRPKQVQRHEIDLLFNIYFFVLTFSSVYAIQVEALQSTDDSSLFAATLGS